jgi:hypothetical protein
VALSSNARRPNSSVHLTGRIVRDLIRRLRDRADERGRWEYENYGPEFFLCLQSWRRGLQSYFAFRSSNRRKIREDLIIFAFNVFWERRSHDPILNEDSPDPRSPRLLAESFIRRWDASDAVPSLLALADLDTAARCVDALVRGFDDPQVRETVSAYPTSIFESRGDGSAEIGLAKAREEHLMGAAEAVRIIAPGIFAIGQVSGSQEKLQLPLDKFLERAAEHYRNHREHLESAAAEWRRLRESHRQAPPSPLQIRTTPLLAALDDALCGTRGRWRLIAALAQDFLDLDKSPEQIRLLVKNHRDLAARSNSEPKTKTG